MKIAHISDFHLRSHLPGTSSTSRRLSRRVPDLLAAAINRIATHQPDLVAVTGDLVDYPFHAMTDNQTIALGEKDLGLVKGLFGSLTCPVCFLPGNHDHPASFHRLFGGAPRDFDVQGYRILIFWDEEVEDHHPQRMGQERQRFLDALSDGDPRPQIHLQHYLTAPIRTRGYPHSYREAASLRRAVVEDPRVRLVLSGHYHAGGRVIVDGGTWFSTAPAFCELPHPFRIYNLFDDGLRSRTYRLLDRECERALQRTVFLDRDGVINPQPSYRTGPEPFELIPGVGDALRRLSRAGFALVVVTNQTAVGSGFVTEDMVAATNDKMARLLAPFGVQLDGVYCRYHGPSAVVPQHITDTPETKPSPVMLHEAARDLNLDVTMSYMIGDRVTDLQAGRSAGCRGCILVRTGEGDRTVERLVAGQADLVAGDLSDAADWILSLSG